MDEKTRPRYRVLTAITPPFVMYNETTNTFYGYCIDLLNDIQSLVGFDYDIRAAFPEEIANWTIWNHAIDELIRNTTDIVVGPVGMTLYRTQRVDFTIPFYRATGYTVMLQKPEKVNPFLKFVMLLESEVWIGFALAFLVTTFLLYLFERCSPFSYRNNREKYKNEPDDRFCSLKECFWFTFTSLTPQGSGPVPKSLSGKVVTTTWWLFGFVIIAAYTANLAAYEMLKRLDTYVESVDDIINHYTIQYSLLENSSAHVYFRARKNLEERFQEMWQEIVLSVGTSDTGYSNYTVWESPMEDKFTLMYNTMEEVGFIKNLGDVVNMVKGVNRNPDFAFIGDDVTIRYLMLTNCGLRKLDEEFGKMPFAFPVQRGSKLKSQIDEAITSLMLRRRLNELEKKWWDENPARVKCPEEKEFNAGFGLDDLAAVFLMIFVGIFIATLILCLQYFWHRNVLRRRKKVLLSRTIISNRKKVNFPRNVSKSTEKSVTDSCN